MNLRGWVAGVVFGATLTMSATASASSMVPEGDFLPVGINVGAAGTDNGTLGFVFGVEASYVHFNRNLAWGGVVADGTYDFGNDAFRHRLGGELGFLFGGVELAYLGESSETFGYRPGFDVRAVLTSSFLSAYGGVGHVFGDGGTTLGEFGALMKFPLPLD